MSIDMEEFNETHAGTHSPFLMVAICLIALGLSSIALFIALTGANKPQAAQAAQMAALEAKIEATETKAHDLEAANQEMHNHLKRLTEESQKAFNSVGLEMGKLHSNITANRNELEKIHDYLNSTPNAQPRAVSTTAAAQTTYTIQSGDTFASIAKEHGLSTQALIDANPGLDPRSLRIGEVIELPTSK